jgi:hypothetical protein
MKRMRTAAYSDSATSESDVENSDNTDNEMKTVPASESNSDNVDDTSSEVGYEYRSDPWAPLKAEAAQQSLSKFEELTQSFTAEGFDENEARDKSYLLILPKLRKVLQIIYLERLSRQRGIQYTKRLWKPGFSLSTMIISTTGKLYRPLLTRENLF